MGIPLTKPLERFRLNPSGKLVDAKGFVVPATEVEVFNWKTKAFPAVPLICPIVCKRATGPAQTATACACKAFVGFAATATVYTFFSFFSSSSNVPTVASPQLVAFPFPKIATLAFPPAAIATTSRRFFQTSVLLTEAPSPHTTTVPSDRRARLCSVPAATAMTEESPAGRFVAAALFPAAKTVPLARKKRR